MVNRKNKLQKEEKTAKDVDAEIIICSHTETALRRLCKTHKELETKKDPIHIALCAYNTKSRTMLSTPS